MKGLELSRAYYDEYGKIMLQDSFGEILPLISVGMAGAGSECYGYDDTFSTDHDFEPGFGIFIPGEDVIDRKTAFALERAYAKLPREFMGFKRSYMLPVGGARHGVIRNDDFFIGKTGFTASQIIGGLSFDEWLSIPSYALLEATNGELFSETVTEFTKARETLEKMPEDVKLKKLAGHLLLMAQSGQYNYPRILKHGETGAAQMAVFEFVKAVLQVTFLLNDRYMPYYKWSFRALRELNSLSELAGPLEELLTTDNSDVNAFDKYETIEGISGMIISELLIKKLTQADCGDLEKHAYSVNDMIQDSGLRNKNILYAV